MKLTIDRTKWLRGEGPGRSFLLRKEDGKMCCLGFYALACGLKESDINGKVMPSSIIIDENFSYILDKMEWLNARVSETAAGTEGIGFVADSLAWCNDNGYLTEQEREAAISGKFAEHDIEVEFVN